MRQTRSYLISRLLYYCVKQPGIYLLMLTGILVDFLVQFPFILVCSIENLIRKPRESSPLRSAMPGGKLHYKIFGGSRRHIRNSMMGRVSAARIIKPGIEK
jgi:hypothetical protein